MRLLSLDVPDEHDALARWLEDRLTGLELRDLIVELESIREDTGRQLSLAEVCGEDLPKALQSGLACLSEATLRSLLRYPETILKLQERILVDGGEYWSTGTVPSSRRRTIDAGWIVLERAIAAEPAQPTSDSAIDRPNRRRLISLAGAAIAATLLAGIVWINLPETDDDDWGWSRPGALTADLSGPRYLNHLADAAGEWFTRPRDSRQALEQRLLEFRSGCVALLASVHPQLNATDREWLLERCRSWVGQIDSRLAEIKTEAALEEVTASADATVGVLVDALRRRASATEIAG